MFILNILHKIFVYAKAANVLYKRIVFVCNTKNYQNCLLKNTLLGPNKYARLFQRKLVCYKFFSENSLQKETWKIARCFFF
jgi:hypothetical protein